MSPWRWLAARFTTTAQRKQSQPLPATVSLAQRVTQCATTVSNTLGPGLPEIIYENALAYQLRKSGLAVSQQQAVAVYYEGVIVGHHTVDVLVENTVLVELKAVKDRRVFDTVQCGKYLKATGHPHGLLLNFGRPRLDVRHVVNGA
jgi:GxxExxY protein